MRFVNLFLLMTGMSLLVGCQPAAQSNSETPSGAAVTTASAEVYCGHCGGTKSETCCEVHDHCEKCDLHKGTTLCCVELGEEMKGKDLCAKCGHEAVAEHKCDAECTLCADCGLHKGAPLCCKLPKPEETAGGADGESSGS